jgi:hypothetical protein
MDDFAVILIYERNNSAGDEQSNDTSGSSGTSTAGISVCAKSWPLTNRGSPIALGKV